MTIRTARGLLFILNSTSSWILALDIPIQTSDTALESTVLINGPGPGLCESHWPGLTPYPTWWPRLQDTTLRTTDFYKVSLDKTPLFAMRSWILPKCTIPNIVGKKLWYYQQILIYLFITELIWFMILQKSIKR